MIQTPLWIPAVLGLGIALLLFDLFLILRPRLPEIKKGLIKMIADIVELCT